LEDEVNDAIKLFGIQSQKAKTMYFSKKIGLYNQV